MLINLQNKGIIGNLAAEALETANIIINRNAVPFDPNPPFYPSGIRIGTPGITSRGMKEKEMKQIASLINRVISQVSQVKKDKKIDFDQEKKKKVREEIIEECSEIENVKKEVLNLCKNFPVKSQY